MNEKVMTQIHKIPKYMLCHIPFIQTTAWAPTIKPQERQYSFLSPICKDYLDKIDSLSNQYHFEFQIIPTLVAEHWQDSINHFNRNEFAHCKYANKLSDYLDNICYKPDSCFVDEVHLANPHLYKNLLNAALNLQ